MKKHCPHKITVIIVFALLFSFSSAYAKDANDAKVLYPDSCKQEVYPDPNEFILLDTEPEMLTMYSPVFPEMATETGVKKADVWVRILVDKCGNVRETMIQIPSGNKCGFNEAALDAAGKCYFSPGISEGQPVASWVTYKFEFRPDLANKDR
jgi:TonB family protein